MSITDSNTDNSEPIARRTRSQIVGPRSKSAQWCSGDGTGSGEQKDTLPLSDSDSSLSSISYLETEFPLFPRALEMDQRNPGLPPDLLDLLNIMTEWIQQHEQLVAGPPPPQNKWVTATRFSWFS